MRKLGTVVTDGAGFLGSDLVGRLLEEGREVIYFDNLISGDLDNIAHFFRPWVWPRASVPAFPRLHV